MTSLKFTEKELTAVIEKAVNNAFAKKANESSIPPYHWSTWLDSISDLANFIGCSYSTAWRLKDYGRVRSYQCGNRFMFYIPDVLDAGESDYLIAKYMGHLHSKN